MAGEKEGAIDPRLLERGYDYRRVLPRDIDDRLLGHIIKKVPGAKRGEEQAFIISEPITPEERGDIDKLEREALTTVIRELVRPATRAIGDGNQNIVPYENRFTVDAAVQEFREIENVLRDTLRRVGNGQSERAKIIQGEMESLRIWMEGNANVLKGSGPMLVAFFDGWAAISNAVRTVPRHDITATDLYKTFASPGEMKNWRLGREVVEKQDRAFKIMRGMAAVHRHRGRNMGQIMEKDYPINDAQIEFVEKVFGFNPKNEKGEDTGPVETIWDMMGKDSAGEKLRKYFSTHKKEQAIDVAKGRLYVVTDETLNMLKGLSGKGKTMWMHGVEWPIDENTIQELRWKVGSGDRILVGERVHVARGGEDDIERKMGDQDVVGIIRKTNREINNLFVMSQDPERVVQVKRGIAVMMGLGTWEKLANGMDVDKAYGEFQRRLKAYGDNFGNYGMDILDDHIVEATRIALLYFCEGGDLGWGFEYKGDEKIKGKKGRETVVNRRIVSFGGTKAATDIPTPYKWLWTEANNGWKMWSHGMLPMDEQTRRQILEHEPGWAPWVDKPRGRWKVSYLGNEFVSDVSPIFPMSFLETATLVNQGPEFRKEVGGKFKPMRLMDLIKLGPKGGSPMAMSEVPWRNMIQEAPYRWYITLSQIAMGISLLSRLPDKETVEKFFGERIDIAKNVQLLELMKRQALGWRDMEADDDVKKFLPFTMALYTAWVENLLETSRNPGRFNPTEVGRTSRLASLSLAELTPKGDREAGQVMASKYRNYMDQLIKVGRAVSFDTSKKQLRSYFR